MKYEKSCGCIIIENNKVLVIKQTNGIWGFPKGHVEGNETEIQTAMREIKEETNIDVKIDETKRYVMNYVTDKGKNKDVVLFLAKQVGGELKKQEEEILEIEWLNYEEALQKLSYDNTKELFKAVMKENNLK